MEIRNFAIIAHVDHGKSTLADRIIEICDGLEKRQMRNQVLDSMDIERERGITIKSQTVRLRYTSKSGKEYILNLMDTPGHVDFTYEVNRSLSACEGSVLVVDASQGVEAQTLANAYQAVDNDHEIIVALNKVDLPSAEPEKIKKQIEEVIGIDTKNAVCISAKNGDGVVDLLENIITLLPAPKIDYQSPLKALLIDSWYDQYLGVVVLVRVFEGVIKKGMKIRMMFADAAYTVEQAGHFKPKKEYVGSLQSGEIGFITGIKHIKDCFVGDTITCDQNPCTTKLKGFKPNLSVVFCSLYPADSKDFNKLKDSLAKLRLNDSSFHFELENSVALGMGFRCGFLGLLHLEIIQERLDREFDVDVVATAPSVIYKIYLKGGEIIEIYNAAEMPSVQNILYIEEPWVSATIIVQPDYLGPIINLCNDKRAQKLDISYVGTRAMLTCLLPLNEIVFDFYDKLKSRSKGYASFNWEMHDYQKGDLVRLNILINKDPVEALSMIVHKSQAEFKGRKLCQRLQELIPRQLFEVHVRAAIGSRIIARETIRALRKDVLAKCYGGDITRKRKLLEKQKAGKKRMRNVGNVEIPQSAFIDALKIKDD